MGRLFCFFFAVDLNKIYGFCMTQVYTVYIVLCHTGSGSVIVLYDITWYPVSWNTWYPSCVMEHISIIFNNFIDLLATKVFFQLNSCQATERSLSGAEWRLTRWLAKLTPDP